jgi:hypothetical protein
MKWQSWQAEPELTDATSFFLRVERGYKKFQKRFVR